MCHGEPAAAASITSLEMNLGSALWDETGGTLGTALGGAGAATGRGSSRRVMEAAAGLQVGDPGAPGEICLCLVLSRHFWL